MSYEPTVWQTGDVVTAEKMNKLEQGVANSGGGGFLLVHVLVSVSSATMDKTWNEINEALDNGIPAFAQTIDGDKVNIDSIYSATINDGQYVVYAFSYENASSITFSSSNDPNGYPAVDISEEPIG